MKTENIQDFAYAIAASSIPSIKYLHIVSHETSYKWWLWMYNQVLLEEPSAFLAAHMLFLLSVTPTPEHFFSTGLPVDVPNLIISSVSSSAVYRFLAWGGQVLQNMMKMSIPFLHLVNQLHTSAKMKSADAVLAALAEGIWKDVCLGCNATFHLETY